MNTRELVIEYINAMQENDERNRKIEEGLNVLCESSNSSVVESLTYRLNKFYDDLLILTVGQNTFDWAIWYLYERRDTPSFVMDDGAEYVIDTPEKLCDICIGLIENDDSI